MKKVNIGITIILIALFAIILIYQINIRALNDIVRIDKEKQEENNKIVLQGEYVLEKGQVYLNWDIENYENYLYKCYQKKEGTTSYQTVSTTTFNEGEYIKVLNIYPGAGNNLASWMNSYGMNIIKVDQTTLAAFNSNPIGYLKDNNGKWKYDVIVFGFWDSNNGQDLNSTSGNIVEQFINEGKGCIFGHDTIAHVSNSTSLNHPYFSSLAKYVNITLRGSWISNATTSVYLNKTGVFTSYPWEIGKQGTYLTIPTSHNLDQTANGDIWIKFNNNTLPGNQNFYLTTWNNCAMIQTGHSNGAATIDEQKILANLIFYTNQLTSTNNMYDYTVRDIKAPNNVTGVNQTIIDNNTINIKYNKSEDNGSIYSYYIEGTSKLDNLQNERSNIFEVNVKSELAGYSYIIDNNEEPNNLDNIIETTETSINISKNGINWAQKVYFHIVAVDNAGNMSNATTIELIGDDPAIFYYYPDENNILLRVISSKELKELKYPDCNTEKEIIVKLNGNKNFAVDYNLYQNKTIKVELTLWDDTIITKELEIPKTR